MHKSNLGRHIFMTLLILIICHKPKTFQSKCIGSPPPLRKSSLENKMFLINNFRHTVFTSSKPLLYIHSCSCQLEHYWGSDLKYTIHKDPPMIHPT
ncbi:hypothetical protein FKM82_025597 [Ascaphus truei]